MTPFTLTIQSPVATPSRAVPVVVLRRCDGCVHHRREDCAARLDVDERRLWPTLPDCEDRRTR